MTCPDTGELERFVERDLDDVTQSSMASHISGCARCAQEVSELEENLRLAASLRRDEENQIPDITACDIAQIGPYRIIRKLGQGGMGTVFEAEQENPRRTVALKVIRPGLVSHALMKRFRHEAQVLGRLKHPGIAQIYEAGSHQTGHGPQPYFVMELVHGRTLIDYAEAEHLDRRARLELMGKICDAVQHAHERSVIHRDLKPDNILIDVSAGTAQPKILDFGVARLVDPEGQTTTLNTNVGQIVGTVAYMSPEQASADPSEIDTRADVYALGVVGYELLTGRFPYKLNVASVAESVRAIVQDEPMPLSSVNRSLRGDVTTIVGKALEKEKSRRYASAAAMAEDIRRHLCDLPIAAHPPSTIYQLGKFARRNKGLVAGMAAAFVLLVLGIIGTSIGMVRARHEAANARSEAQKAKAVNSFVNEMLASASPSHMSLTERAKGPNITMLQVLNEASRKLGSGSLKDQPAIEAAVRTTLGQSYNALGEYATAESHLRTALALGRSLYGDAHLDVARQRMSLADALHHQGKLDEAEPLYRQALDARRTLTGDASSEVAESLICLGAIARDRGNLADAESLFSQALQIHRQRLGEEDRAVAADLNYLAAIHEKAGRFADAEPLYRRAIEIRRKAVGDEHPDVATGMNDLAVLLYRQGRLEEAEQSVREALAMRRKLLSEDHPEVASSMSTLAAILHARRNYVEAEELFRQSLQILRKTFGEEHEDVTSGMSNLGMMLLEQGKLAEAEPLFRRALQINRKLFPPDHPELCAALNNLAGLLRDQKKFDQAEPLFRESLEIRRNRLGKDHPELAVSLNNYAAVLRDLHRPADAEPYHRQALAIIEPKLGAKHLTTALLRSSLGACLFELGRFDEAEPLLVEALAVIRKALGDSDKRTIGVANRLISTYESQGKHEQADALRPLVAATNPTSNPTTAPAQPAPASAHR